MGQSDLWDFWGWSPDSYIYHEQKFSDVKTWLRLLKRIKAKLGINIKRLLATCGEEHS